MNNATWELWLIVMTKDATSSTSSWKGKIFSRHGNHSFPKWWKQEWGDCVATKVVGNIPHSARSYFDFCVYVKVIPSLIGALTDMYLNAVEHKFGLDATCILDN